MAQSKLPQHLVLTNTQAFDRMGEVVAIHRLALGSVMGKQVLVLSQHGHRLTTQLVDTTGDGAWDVLLAEVSVMACSTDTLQLQWVKAHDVSDQKQWTNVRFSLRSNSSQPSDEIRQLTRTRGFTQNIAKPVYQLEGPGIENDKVAFRAFFDRRNGKDVYGKLTPEPILDRVGLGGSWHTLQDWGMDILKTGESLGAGALAVRENGQLYRLADADTSVFTALYEGPLQAAFRFNFKNWDVGGSKSNGSEMIRLTKGDYFYQNVVFAPLRADQQLVAGIANFKAIPVMMKRHNAQFSSISIYGRQVEGSDTNLGLALLVHNDELLSQETTELAAPIPNTSFVILKPIAGKRTTLHFFACWEKTDPQFATAEGFLTYLQQTADRLANPFKIQILYPHSKKYNRR